MKEEIIITPTVPCPTQKNHSHLLTNCILHPCLYSGIFCIMVYTHLAASIEWKTGLNASSKLMRPQGREKGKVHVYQGHVRRAIHTHMPSTRYRGSLWGVITQRAEVKHFYSNLLLQRTPPAVTIFLHNESLSLSIPSRFPTNGCITTQAAV